MSVDLGDLERPEADGIIGVAEPGRREVDTKPAAKLQQRTCADGLGAQVAARRTICVSYFGRGYSVLGRGSKLLP